MWDWGWRARRRFRSTRPGSEPAGRLPAREPADSRGRRRWLDRAAGGTCGWTTSARSIGTPATSSRSERRSHWISARRSAGALPAGVDYDLANTWFGNADAVLRYTAPWITVAGGLRQYRPHFDLWTIWGVFSPVPYHAADAAVFVRPVRALELRGRGERYALLRHRDRDAAGRRGRRRLAAWRGRQLQPGAGLELRRRLSGGVWSRRILARLRRRRHVVSRTDDARRSPRTAPRWTARSSSGSTRRRSTPFGVDAEWSAGQSAASGDRGRAVLGDLETGRMPQPSTGTRPGCTRG